MKGRYVRVVATGVLTCGLAAFAPENGRAQDNQQQIPLVESPQATLTGCFVRGETAGHKTTYVLANPIVGSVASVPDGNCTASGQLIKLERIKKSTLDNINVGTMVVVTGRLERAYSGYFKHPDRRLRELEVADAKEVPVEAPRTVALVMPAPSPAPEMPSTIAPPAAEPEAVAPAPAPVGTTGVIRAKRHHRMPHTASQVPLVGLIGLLALAGAFALRRIPSQQTV